MSDCRCCNPTFHQLDFVSVPIGVDMAHGRFGEVAVETCVHCAKKWLSYFVQYESFTASGRWFRGPISDAALGTITPEIAVPFLSNLPWHFRGGSYFSSSGELDSGAVRADLYLFNTTVLALLINIGASMF